MERVKKRVVRALKEEELDKSERRSRRAGLAATPSTLIASYFAVCFNKVGLSFFHLAMTALSVPFKMARPTTPKMSYRKRSIHANTVFTMQNRSVFVGCQNLAVGPPFCRACIFHSLHFFSQTFLEGCLVTQRLPQMKSADGGGQH